MTEQLILKKYKSQLEKSRNERLFVALGCLLIFILLVVILAILDSNEDPPPDEAEKETPPWFTGSANNSDCVCGDHYNTATRIVGGRDTEIREYPWQVGLMSWRDCMIMF